MSEPDSGLIQDEDNEPDPVPASVAALASQAAAQPAARYSIQAGAGRSPAKQRDLGIDLGTDGMVELDMDADLEPPSQSFSERLALQNQALQGPSLQPSWQQQQQPQLHQPQPDKSSLTGKDISTKAQPASANHSEPAKTAPSEARADAAAAAAAAAAETAPGSADTAGSPDVLAQAQAQTLGELALSPVPLLQPVRQESAPPPAASASLAAAATSGAAAAAAPAAEGVDFQDIALEEIQLSPGTDAKAADVKAAPVPATVATKAQDEWEEVNLARAREMALAADASAAPMPGDKVSPALTVAICCFVSYAYKGTLQFTALAIYFTRLVHHHPIHSSRKCCWEVLTVVTNLQGWVWYNCCMTCPIAHKGSSAYPSPLGSAAFGAACLVYMLSHN